jgi:hypothetical protein
MSTIGKAPLLLTLAASLAGGAWAADKPVRLFAEGEDFKLVSGDWKIVPWPENYYAATFAICFLSRMGCLAAPAQVEKEAVAALDIEIPVAADYQVFARYEQPVDFSVEFTVEVVQGGKVACRETFGRLEDPKIWALNGHKRVPMEYYAWGGTDNIVWQEKGVARLAAGPATLRLIAAPQLDADKKPRKMAAKRHVDVICLTDDAAGIEAQRKSGYLEMDGWLVQDGDLFVRFTNPKDGLGPCIPIVQPNSGGQHSPYWVHVRDWPTTQVLKSGQLVSETSYQIAGPRSKAVKPDLLAPILDPAKFQKIPDEEYLQPGQSSGWVPMGQALDALNNSQWFPTAKYKDAKTSEIDLQLEFAVPTRRGNLDAVRKVRVKGKPDYYSPVTFEIPGNVTKRPVIRTQIEALQWLKAEIAKFPKKGSTPKRLAIYGIMEFSGATGQDSEIGKLATEIALALGDNTLSPLRGPWAERLGVPKRRTGLVAHWYPSDLKGFQKTVEEADQKGRLQHVAIVSYGDEIHIPPAKGDDARLAAWLKERGVAVEGEPKFTEDPQSPLFYYSKLWAIEEGIRHYAEATKWLEGRIGQGVLTGANYSPHANYLVTDLQWVRPFKMRGMTMPWSEDYVAQIPEFSIQVVGYQTSGFRAGAKYHKLPIMMYVMPHYPNQVPRDFRLSFYTCIAHGATKTNYFCASPLATGGTENYIVTDGLPMWRAVHDVTHEAGTFEDYVLDGTVRPAKVGLLLSSVDEILTGDTNFKGGIHNAERKGIYFALRHAQVPVDFLTEDDVIDGLAKDYKLIYVTQQFLHSKAVKALAEWAKAGGTVVALCGGGFTNEFGKPNPDAEALYGAKGATIAKDPKLPMILPKQHLPPSSPLDVVTLTVPEKQLVQVEVIAWKQEVAATDGKPRAYFSDGKPAIIEKQHGKGKAVLFAFLPGLAYMKGGLPLRPPDRGATEDAFAHFLPTPRNRDLRHALVDAFLPEGFVRPVECSEPLVETTCIDTASPPRLAIPLMNYTGKPIPRLSVEIAGLASAKSIRSVERGPLKPRFWGGNTVLTLPLDTADMLLVDR